LPPIDAIALVPAQIFTSASSSLNTYGASSPAGQFSRWIAVPGLAILKLWSQLMCAAIPLSSSRTSS
jgi:hypothetical protein